MLGAQSIQLGHSDVVVAGGMESMSNIPYIMRSARSGSGYGHQMVEDLLLADGEGLSMLFSRCETGG